jgi:hypothetical protein
MNKMKPENGENAEWAHGPIRRIDLYRAAAFHALIVNSGIEKLESPEYESKKADLAIGAVELADEFLPRVGGILD